MRRLVGYALVALIVLALLTQCSTTAASVCGQAAPAPRSVTTVVESAGVVVHDLSTRTPTNAEIEAHTRGTWAVLGAWVDAFAAAVRGQERPARAVQLEVRTVAVAQARSAPCVAPGPVPAGVVAAGLGQCPPSGSSAERGLTPAALRVLRCGAEAFPALRSFGGVGARANVSDHPSGNAVDFMVPDYASPGGRALGDSVAAFFVAGGEGMAVKYIIWNGRITSLDGRGWRPYTHPSGGRGDTLAHRDHVHVSVRSGGSA